MAEKKVKIYSVSEINSLIKVTLEAGLPSQVTVAGEISQWKRHGSGHCYFSLKDENSVLPCVMWRSDFGKVKFSPEAGMAVLATGFIDVYAPQGRYQFMVSRIIPAGVGALQLAFEQMVKRLTGEGLFDEGHKKALPRYPERIGILTSESGAAVGDISHSIHSRWPCARLFLYPVPVQGEGAAEEIAAALREVNRRNRELGLDIVIVGRGGGSPEDLWEFNEEVLARAIFDSRIPVISAVGHEYDTTIADMVADARASTPTKAGVIAVPDMAEVLGQLANMAGRLKGDIETKLELGRRGLETLLGSAVFRNPLLAVRNREQQLDELGGRVTGSVKELLVELGKRLHLSYERVARIEPHRLLGRRGIELNELRNRALAGIRAITNKRQIELTAQGNRLAGLNPKTVLQRGYSITTSKRTGLLVRGVRDVKIGELVVTELKDENLIESEVKSKQNRGR